MDQAPKQSKLFQRTGSLLKEMSSAPPLLGSRPGRPACRVRATETKAVYRGRPVREPVDPPNADDPTWAYARCLGLVFGQKYIYIYIY